MKQNKEYPATHSMDTAWFAIDEDGNVAVMNYHEDGPVPKFTPSDLCVDDITIDKLMLSDDKSVRYTEAQIGHIIECMHPYKEETDSDVWGIIFVVLSEDGKYSFIRTLESEKYSNLTVISEKDNMYMLSFTTTMSDYIFNAMRTGVIVKWAAGSDFEYSFYVSEEAAKNYPYFFYDQTTHDYMDRISIPAVPYKESQLTDSEKREALRLPVKFNEMEHLQIMRYAKFGMWGNMDDYCIINGYPYYKGHMEDGSIAYFNSSIFPHMECGQTCKLCNMSFSDPDANEWNCRGSYSKTFFIQGTESSVMMIYPIGLPKKEKNAKGDKEINWKERYDCLKNIIEIPIIQGVPNITTGYLLESEIARTLGKNGIEMIFANCCKNLETIIDLIKPHVLLFTEGVELLLKKAFVINNGKVNINSTEYPYYLLECIENNIEEIKDLASRPFRGNLPQHIYTADEIDEEKIKFPYRR